MPGLQQEVWWDEYATHTKCVSEAERYQGHLYQAKENKGEKKQADWLGAVHAKLQAGGEDKQLNGYIESVCCNTTMCHAKRPSSSTLQRTRSI